jgi:hypothetical protein
MAAWKWRHIKYYKMGWFTYFYIILPRLSVPLGLKFFMAFFCHKAKMHRSAHAASGMGGTVRAWSFDERMRISLFIICTSGRRVSVSLARELGFSCN